MTPSSTYRIWNGSGPNGSRYTCQVTLSKEGVATWSLAGERGGMVGTWESPPIPITAAAFQFLADAPGVNARLQGGSVLGDGASDEDAARILLTFAKLALPDVAFSLWQSVTKYRTPDGNISIEEYGFPPTDERSALPVHWDAERSPAEYFEQSHARGRAKDRASALSDAQRALQVFRSLARDLGSPV